MPPTDDVIDTPGACVFASTISVGLATNDTETDLSASMVRLQVVRRPLLAQAPPQPANEVSSRVVTVSVTCCPGAKSAVQVLGQDRPLGPWMTPPRLPASVSSGLVTTVIDRKSWAVCP